MLPIILLCMLLQAFATCSLANIAEQSQNLPNEPNSLEDLKAALIETSKSTECPILFLSRVVALGQVAERCWNMCLNKMSAYSQNQEFFTNTLPAFIDETEQYPARSPPLKFTADTLPVSVKIPCEQQSTRAFLDDLSAIRSFFNDECDPFEGLSDEFLTVAADYMRSTIGIQKLFIMMEDPDEFTDIQFQSVDHLLSKQRLVDFLVNLKKLVRQLQEVDLVDICQRFLSAIKTTRKTMVSANEVLVDFLTEFLVWKISRLAERASKIISVPCSRFGLAKPANDIIAEIEAITIPLYRANFDLSRGVAERQRGEVCWNNFLQSSFAFESILVKPNLSAMKRISETCSEFIDHFLGAFLRGEDEPWTFGLQSKLGKATTLWRRAIETVNSISDAKIVIPWSKYMGWLVVDVSIIMDVINVVEELEDPLALDRPTREKFVEFWKEAQALSRLLRSLLLLKKMQPCFETIIKCSGDTFMKESLSDMLDEQINFLQRQSINFQVGKYPQFINELPAHQEAIAQRLNTFSGDLSRFIVEEAVISMVEEIFSPLKSPIYTPLKRSLLQLFTSPSELFQPQSLPSRTNRPKNKKSRQRGSKFKQNLKSHRAAVPKAPVSTNMQAFVRSGPQYVDDVSERAEDSLKLLDENVEKSWTFFSKSRSRQTFGILANQTAREVLRRFVNKPLGWDEIPLTDPQDMRRDKQQVKIAAFNVEWLFLFDLSTDKLYGKVKWKSLKEAWDHIKDVAAAIRKIDADIICLCEVQDLRILSILVELLPELGYRAYLIPSHDSLGQNVGILTRVDTLASITRIEDWSFPKNIVLHLKLDNGWGDLVDLVVTGVHLISSTAESDHAERARHREDQARALKQQLVMDHGTPKQTIHLVLGDFNMVDPELLSAQPAELLEGALQVVKHEEFNLFNTMGPKKAPSNRSSLPSGVCHIFTSHPELVADAQIVSLGDGGASYRLERVSDHLPVVATINLTKHSQ